MTLMGTERCFSAIYVGEILGSRAYGAAVQNFPDTLREIIRPILRSRRSKKSIGPVRLPT